MDFWQFWTRAIRNEWRWHPVVLVSVIVLYVVVCAFVGTVAGLFGLLFSSNVLVAIVVGAIVAALALIGVPYYAYRTSRPRP